MFKSLIAVEENYEEDMDSICNMLDKFHVTEK